MNQDADLKNDDELTADRHEPLLEEFRVVESSDVVVVLGLRTLGESDINFPSQNRFDHYFVIVGIFELLKYLTNSCFLLILPRTVSQGLMNC